MLEGLINDIECEICGASLKFSAAATINDYSITISTTTSNVFDKVEDIIGKYLVYECTVCNAKYKYTYKDLEKILRKSLTQKMLMLAVRGDLINNSFLQDKLFIYCGKCGGFDGSGICPKTVFNKCDIKRFPVNG